MPAEAFAVEASFVHGTADRINVHGAASIALDFPELKASVRDGCGGSCGGVSGWSREQDGAEDTAGVLDAFACGGFIMAVVVNYDCYDVVGLLERCAGDGEDGVRSC